jgi:multimeric flavodoxin WrbA
MKVLLLDCLNNKNNIDTHNAIKSLIKGIKSAGGEVKHIEISNLDIKPCLACTDDLLFSSNNECRCDDDMNNLYPEFRNSDIWVFATHINSNGSSEFLRNFLDRLEPLFQPFYIYENNQSTIIPQGNKINGKILLLSSYEYEYANLARQISEHIDSLGLLFSKESENNILFDSERIDEQRLNMIYERGKSLISNESKS